MQKRVAIVTGASSGIGYETAIKLAENNIAVVLAARNRSRLQKVAEEINESGGNALAIPTNVADYNEFQLLCKKTIENYGSIDILVNCAGIMPLSFLENGQVTEWHSMIDTNIKGVLHGISSVLPYMKTQNRGYIINISSTAGYEVAPGGAVYSATKFAVRAISEGLRKELEMKNSKIKSILISPGPVDTDLTSTINDSQIKRFMEGFPIPKINPAEIAATILYLIEQPDSITISELIIRPTFSK